MEKEKRIFIGDSLKKTLTYSGTSGEETKVNPSEFPISSSGQVVVDQSQQNDGQGSEEKK